MSSPPLPAPDDPLVRAGLLPATTGRRLLAALGTAVLGLAAVAIYLSIIAAMPDPGRRRPLLEAVAVAAGYGVVNVVLLLRRATTIGGLLVGLCTVSARTGRPAGAAALLKFVLQGMVGLVTLGVGHLALAMTLRPPRNQHWADRSIDVVVVDTVAGANPRTRRASSRGPGRDGGPGGAQPEPPGAPETMPLMTVSPDTWDEPDPAVAESTLDAPPTTIRRAGPELIVRLDDGVTVPVRHPIVLGRKPAPPSGREGARLLTIDDRARSISKTHLAIGPAGAGVWVEDLESTNGVIVVDGTGRHRIAPGRRHLVLPGATVQFGDRSFIVLHTP